MTDSSDNTHCSPTFLKSLKDEWQQQLLKVPSCSDNQDLRRYEIIQCSASSFIARNLFPFSQESVQVLRMLYEIKNNDEPIYFRIYGAFFLGLQYTGGLRAYFDPAAPGYEAFVVQCFTDAINGCYSKEAESCWDKIVPCNGNGYKSVKEIFDIIKQAAHRRKEHVENPEATLQPQEEAFALKSSTIKDGPLSQPKVAKELCGGDCKKCGSPTTMDLILWLASLELQQSRLALWINSKKFRNATKRS